MGFNSSKYDMCLIKRKLAKHLKLDDRERFGFTIKKGSAYACIATPQFRFLDISHFLALGTSYAEFLKAYGVSESKGFFPYEWFDHASKLNSTSLPPKESFYSSLKNEHITDENYQFCLEVWDNEGMTTFKDFLVWYNNLDVGPFVKGVQELQSFYFGKNIDVLKTTMSVPGVARQLLFKTAREQAAEFSLLDKKNRDLYFTIKNNIVGGLLSYSQDTTRRMKHSFVESIYVKR